MPQHHHDGYVDGVTFTVSLCLTYTLCISILRAWIRRRLYGVDDVMVAITTVFILAFYAACYVSIGAGLGKPLRELYADDFSKLGTLNRSTIARLVLYILTLYLSKASVVTFLFRMTKTTRHQAVYSVAFVFVCLLGLSSILTVTVDCGEAKRFFFWDLRNTAPFCSSQSTRWAVVMALDVGTEVALAILPLHMMWGLQMPLKKKLVIIAAFYTRLPTIAFSIMGNYYTIVNYPYDRDPGLAGALITIWQVVEVAYSLAAVTIASSKAFADAFATGFGWGDTFRQAATQYAMENELSQRSRNQSATKDSARRSGDVQLLSQPAESQRALRDNKGSYAATVRSEERSAPQSIEAENEIEQANGPNYAANEYKSYRARQQTLNRYSEYQDPLEGEREDSPMKLRPERKLRNTAVVTSDPSGHKNENDAAAATDKSGIFRKDAFDIHVSEGTDVRT